MAKFTRWWPCSRMRSASSRWTSASVRPPNGRSRISAATRSTARAAAPSCSISAASLRMRSGPVTSVAVRKRAPGSAPADRARTGPRSAPRSRPSRRPRRRGRATRASGSSVSSHGADREHVGLLDHPRRLEARHDQRGLAVAWHDEHRDPLQRHRLVPREVRQVGADREEQRVEPGDRHLLPHPREAGRVRAHRAGSPGRPSMLTAFFSAWYARTPSRPRRSAHSSRVGRSPT